MVLVVFVFAIVVAALAHLRRTRSTGVGRIGGPPPRERARVFPAVCRRRRRRWRAASQLPLLLSIPALLLERLGGKRISSHAHSSFVAQSQVPQPCGGGGGGVKKTAMEKRETENVDVSEGADPKLLPYAGCG